MQHGHRHQHAVVARHLDLVRPRSRAAPAARSERAGRRRPSARRCSRMHARRLRPAAERVQQVGVGVGGVVVQRAAAPGNGKAMALARPVARRVAAQPDRGAVAHRRDQAVAAQHEAFHARRRSAAARRRRARASSGLAQVELHDLVRAARPCGVRKYSSSPLQFDLHDAGRRTRRIFFHGTLGQRQVAHAARRTASPRAAWCRWCARSSTRLPGVNRMRPTSSRASSSCGVDRRAEHRPRRAFGLRRRPATSRGCPGRSRFRRPRALSSLSWL